MDKRIDILQSIILDARDADPKTEPLSFLDWLRDWEIVLPMDEARLKYDNLMKAAGY